MLRALSCGSTVAALGAVAGCLEPDPSAGLHAVSVTIVHRPGFEDLQYPEDLAVRVAVENTSADRRRGTLSASLERDGDSTAGPGSWSQTQSVTLQAATTRNYIFGFDGVADERDSESVFDASAEVLDQGVV